jgi:hypothetical protein
MIADEVAPWSIDKGQTGWMTLDLSRLARAAGVI